MKGVTCQPSQRSPIRYQLFMERTFMCDLTGRLLHQPVSQVIMHRNHEYKVDSVTSVGSVSRPKSKNERRCSLDVTKVISELLNFCNFK